MTHGPRGTARWWKIGPTSMAGKTGTSQVKSFASNELFQKCENLPLKERHHAWFVGYAPAEKPEITVGVLAEHACSGPSGAVPVVRDYMRAYFKKYKT